MKIISTPRRMKLFWQLAKQWFTQQFEAVASSIDFTEVEEKIDDVKDDVADVKSAVENIDFSTLATEANATANKEAIIAAMPSVPTVQQIQNGLATESNATSNKEAIIAAMSEISVDTSNLATKAVEQWLGLEESYEAQAKGGERTNNTVIDECKVRFQDAFNGLLPTGFTMPNSVTVDNLTYTGTTNS